MTISYASGVGNDSVTQTCLSLEFICSFLFSLLVLLCGYFVVFFFLKMQSIILKPYNMLTEQFIITLLLSELSQNTFVRTACERICVCVPLSLSHSTKNKAQSDSMAP